MKRVVKLHVRSNEPGLIVLELFTPKDEDGEGVQHDLALDVQQTVALIGRLQWALRRKRELGELQ